MAAESRLEGVDLDARPQAAATMMLAEPPSSAPVRAGVAAALHVVDTALREQPHSFGFFQAVRLLERLQPDRNPVGEWDNPAREVVRFGVNPSLAFPASEIQQLDLDGEQPEMMVNFMGLTGPQGVLPHPYSMLVNERLRARDGALAEFLDIFHHRLLSLFYQAWRKYRFTVAREDAATDPLAARLGDLIGLGLETVPSLPFPLEALIFRTGLLAAQPRGAVALEQLLVDFFDVPADVQQMVGGWYALGTNDRCAIGEEEQANVLGGGAVVGDEIWDQQARVRIRIGPVDRARYDSFLPGGSAHEALASLLRFFSDDRFDFEVQLVLARQDVFGLSFGPTDEAAHRLGWSTWICSAPRDRDAEETIVTLQTRAAS